MDADLRTLFCFCCQVEVRAVLVWGVVDTDLKTVLLLLLVRGACGVGEGCGGP